MSFNQGNARPHQRECSVNSQQSYGKNEVEIAFDFDCNCVSYDVFLLCNSGFPLEAY